MLLKLFRANNFYQFILFPVFGILLLLPGFINPVQSKWQLWDAAGPLAINLGNWIMEPTLNTALAYLLAMVLCFLLVQINARFAFVKEPTFLPTYLFLLIVFALPELQVVSPVMFAAVFIVLAIRSIFSAFEKQHAYSNAFDAGFLLGLAGLFYMPVSALVVLVPFAILILRNNAEWREWMLPFVGLFFPWMFSFLAYFIWSDVSAWFELLTSPFTQNRDIGILFELPFQLYLLFLLFLIVLASIFILKQYGEKGISTRRYFKILALFFGASLLLLIFPFVSYELLVILAIPLTFLFTNYLLFSRRRLWAEVFMWLLLIFSVVIQFLI